MPEEPATSPQFYSTAEDSEFFDAGPITFGVEYRLFFAKGSDEPSTDTLVDAGISVYVFDRGADPSQERLRFDCLQVHPHYHYIDRARNRDGLILYDTAANGDPWQWTLECLKTRLPAMLARAGAGRLAQDFDQHAVDGVIPKIAGVAQQLQERTLISWKGQVHWTGAETREDFVQHGLAILAHRASGDEPPADRHTRA